MKEESTKNLWILTEELPKKEVLKMIFTHFADDFKCGFLGGDIRIIPLLDKKKNFDFTYKVIGFCCGRVSNVYIKTVSGTSSFVDHLVFYQTKVPDREDTPLYVIEETKTDDAESRNTGVYQRYTKFIFAKYYYPKSECIMLYALKVKQKETPTSTYIFGTRLLLTLGITILGKELDPNIFKPFSKIDDVIHAKNSMKDPPRGNIPIKISKENERITISGRLKKSNRLAHDPNIGALTLISATLRHLGWKKEIQIIKHQLIRDHITSKNKFIQAAWLLGITIAGLPIPNARLNEHYWYYENKGEKLGTIFIHIVVENFTENYAIFDNHAGCEKSYFHTSKGDYIPLQKYTDQQEYKKGDKSKIVNIPDLVLIDIKDTQIITVEGKTYNNRKKGINELRLYNAFESIYLQEYYPTYKNIRTVVLYGSNQETIAEVEVGFLLNSKGKIILGIKAPKLFKKAITNLLDYWN